MDVGYIRISTEDQNTARQDVLMEELGVTKVFTDKSSGKDTARPGLQKMLSFVREGDTVIVESYSRLARSTRDLLDLVEHFEKNGINFISKKEAIDTTTPAGRLMLTIFAGIAQFERDCNLDRQREGIAEAKKAGKYKGRKPIAVDAGKFKKLYADWKAGKITAVNMQKQLGLTPPTFYRRVKEYEAEKGCVNRAI